MFDRYKLIKDMGLKLRTRTSLHRLGIVYFEDLLDISYSRFEYLNENALMDIKKAIHNEGYLLFNEKATISEKRDELISNGYVTLDLLGFNRPLYLVLYKYNIFTLRDLEKAYLGLFKLKNFGPVKYKDLKETLERLKLDFSNIKESDSEYLTNKLRNEDKRYTRRNVDFSLIKLTEVSGIYIKLVDELTSVGIYTLADLVKYSYSELKSKVKLSDICVVELINFLYSIGLSIKGYDQTTFKDALEKNSSDKSENNISNEELEREKIKINIEKNLNVELNVRVKEKKILLDEYTSLMEKRSKLIEEEKELDARIDEVLASLKGKRYGKKR